MSGCERLGVGSRYCDGESVPVWLDTNCSNRTACSPYVLSAGLYHVCPGTDRSRCLACARRSVFPSPELRASQLLPVARLPRVVAVPRRRGLASQFAAAIRQRRCVVGHEKGSLRLTVPQVPSTLASRSPPKTPTWRLRTRHPLIRIVHVSPCCSS